MTDDEPTLSVRALDAAGGPAPRRGSRRRLWLAIAGGAIVLALGVWLVVAKLPRLLMSPQTPAAADVQSTAAAARKIQATLFYVSDDGEALVAAAREVAYGATPAEQVRRIVEAEVQTAPGDARSAIPAGTTVRSVFLAPHGEAYVDLGGAIVSGHSGGSLDEALAVYAIVNAVTVNMHDIPAVQILVEGHQVDTLVGHLDLRYPLEKALDWVRKGQ